MVPALTGPVLVAAALLALAAPAKWRRPDDTVRALRAAGLPAGRWEVRALAVGEVGLALAVLLVPGPVVLVLLALAYAGFAGFVVLALRAGTPLASCGCFGRPDTPPTRVHVALVSLLALAAGTAAVTGSAGLSAVLGGPWAGLPLLAAVAVGTWLAWAALALLPALQQAARRPAERDSTFRLVGP